MSKYIYRAGSAVLVCAIILHVLWGVTLLGTSVELNTTPMAYLLRIAGQPLAAALMLGAAALAFVGMRHPGWTGLALASFQNVLLWLAASGGVTAVLAGHYPDGTVPAAPTHFIFVDQLPIMLFAVLHAAACMTYHGRQWTPPRS